MECPECGWGHVAVGIISSAMIAAVIAFLFKFIIVPKIERKYERNEFNVHVGVMGFVNSFDCQFKFFYELFESKIAIIRELNKNQWMPKLFDSGDFNETGGMNINPLPEHDFVKNMEFKQNFDKWNDDIFLNYEKAMRDDAKRLFEYIEKNENYLDPSLRIYIQLYVNSTIHYVQWLRRDYHQPEHLSKRLEHAKEIIILLKKEESFGTKFTRFRKREKFEDIPHIGEFVKKWKDYEESERNSQNTDNLSMFLI